MKIPLSVINRGNFYKIQPKIRQALRDMSIEDLNDILMMIKDLDNDIHDELRRRSPTLNARL